MENEKTLPLLNNEELRVLGSLIEKSRTTPEYYPLTLNSLNAACNQKSSRKPIVNYDEGIVVQALDSLKKKGLIATVVGGGSRVIKYKHNLAIHYPLIPAELTIIGLLILRGPLTVGEINSNSGRMYNFDSLAEIQQYVDALMESNDERPAMLTLLPRKSGQKEVRYMHLLGGIPEPEVEEYFSENRSDVSYQELADRVHKLEEELAETKEKLDMLMKELMG
ncbi:YceH family protein [Olivibacter sitiensis]|uniref:YceH family protein n=1 Tax=Olivibacter sitiensis TaxID=376470 RepID=UPI0004053C5E|nr:YceH family protein [Olivibacter sitiensis]